MTPLYTVNKSPYGGKALESCLAHLAPEGAVLLIEDGVMAALAAAETPTRLGALAAEARLYVLEPDLASRGLADAPLLQGIRKVDHGGFVDLCVRHAPIVAWL